MKGILVTLCLLASAFGQVVQIKDGSPSDSPLTFKGSITYGAPYTNSDCTIVAHNGGSRRIVAFLAQLNVMRADGHYFNEPFRHDHFFGSDEMLAMMAFNSGQDFDPGINCSEFGGTKTTNEAMTPQPPWMTITTTMVQFDDGSVWGDPASAKEIMFQRNEAIAYLQSLKASDNLTDALAHEPPMGIERNSDHHLRWERTLQWSYISEKTTPQAQADELNRRLAIAQAHAAWIKDQ